MNQTQRSLEAGRFPVRASVGRWARGCVLGIVGITGTGVAVSSFAEPAQVAGTPAPHHSVERCRPGPWGDLQVLRIVTEAPTELAECFLKYDAGVWYLQNTSPESFQQFLKDNDVPEAVRKAIGDATNVDICGGIVVRPDDALVLSIPPESRAVIYKQLGTDPRNYLHTDPFRYDVRRLDEWLDGSGLPAKTVALVHKLVYRQGNTAMFVDIGPVFRTLTTDDEKLVLLKTLTRKPALLVQLRVDEKTDAKALLDYWGVGPNRRKDISPLINSLKKVPGGATLDAAHLLPRFPRKLLYSYPEPPREGADAPKPYDCHWSSLNFWNDPAQDKFTSAEEVFKALTTDYDKVADKTYRLGDVIMLMRPPASGIHSCVYVADDIVFTKNGASVASPWTLKRLSDVIAYYETQGAVEINVYRHK